MKKTKLLFLNAFVKWKSGNISQYFRQRTNKLLSRLDVATLGHHLVTLHSWYYPQFKETNQRQLTLSNRVSSSRADVTKKFAPSAIPSTQSKKLYLKEIPNWTSKPLTVYSANILGMWRLRNSTLVSAARVYSQVGARQDDMNAGERRHLGIQMF